MKLVLISIIGWTVGSALIISLNSPKSLLGNTLVRRINGNPANNNPKELTAPKPPVKPKPEDISNQRPGPGGDKQFSQDEQYRDTLQDKPAYEKGYDFWHSGNRPSKGTTGVYKDEENKIIEIYYGAEAKLHGLNVAWNNKANGREETEGIHLNKASPEERKKQRADALRYYHSRKDIVIDEEPPASANHDDFWTTKVEVSPGESMYQAQMLKKFELAAEKENPDYTLRYFDHRDDSMKAEMQRELDAGTLRLYGGPEVKGYPKPKHPSADFTSGIGKQRDDEDRDRSRSPTIVDRKTTRDKSPRKRSGIGEIQSHEGDYQDPTNGYKDQIDSYIDAMHLAQNNITDLIWPTIENMMASSNSALIYDAAFSLYAEMTMAPVSVMGPFVGGMHAFDQYEDSLVASGASEATMTLIYAMDEILIKLYQTAWENATAAANATDLLGDLTVLAEYLTPADRSLLPDRFDAVDVNAVDNFASFVPSKDRYVNTTQPGLNVTLLQPNMTPRDLA